MNNKDIFDTILSNKTKYSHNSPIACWGEKSSDFLLEQLRENGFGIWNLDFNHTISLEKVQSFEESKSDKVAIVFSNIQNASPEQNREIFNAIVNLKFYDIDLKKEDMLFVSGSSIDDCNIPLPILNRVIHLDLMKD